MIQVGTRGYRDVYATWQAKAEIEDNGVILVRPDGYIAWRMQQPSQNTQHLSVLRQVLAQLNLNI